MTTDLIALAARLVEARRSLKPVPAFPDMTKAQASLVKDEVIRLLSNDRQHPVIGYKVSLSYTWGALFEQDLSASPARRARSSLFDPLIEVEAVFHLEADIGAEMSAEQILERSRVGAGIEIADARWAHWDIRNPVRPHMPSAAEIEADNAFSCTLVLGEETSPGRILTSLPALGARMLRDGHVCAEAPLARVMGHPANAVLWLANALAERGERLHAGQIVTSGCPASALVTIAPGDHARFVGEIDGLGAAELTIF